MKKLLKSIIIATLSLTTLSCSDNKENTAHQEAANRSIELLEEQCAIYEDIKDQASAETAFNKLDEITEKYAQLVKDVKALGAGNIKLTKEQLQTHRAKVESIQDRMLKASESATAFFNNSDPDLRAKFSEKILKLQEAKSKGNN